MDSKIESKFILYYINLTVIIKKGLLSRRDSLRDYICNLLLLCVYSFNLYNYNIPLILGIKMIYIIFTCKQSVNSGKESEK